MRTKRIKKREAMRKRRMRLKRRRILLSLVFVLSILILGSVYIFFYRYVAKLPEDEIFNNIYVGTLDMAGLTKADAAKLLDEQLARDVLQTVSLTAGSETVEATLEEYGLSYEDRTKLIDQAFQYGREGSLWERFFTLRKLEKEKKVFGGGLCVDKELGEALLAERAVPLMEHAQDAVITKQGNEFTVKEGVEGETVDIEKTLETLTDYLNQEWNHQSISLSPEVMKEEPAIKKADLETIQDVLGTFSTDAGEGSRVINLQTGVDLLDGKVVMPGEELSVFEVTGPYDAEHGYVLGRSYENGEVVESYGGGICQVSTTLYNAALYAELEVTERTPHSKTVSYVEPSRDAAIATGVKDFKFKNNYETPIYIHAEIDSAGQMIFMIYGKETREPGRSVEFESEITGTDEAKTVYEANSSEKVGYMETVSYAQNGLSARLWKIVNQDGQEVSREECNTSYYGKTDHVIEVGTRTESTEVAAAIQDAIAKQDYDAIQAAIAMEG